MQEQRKLNTLLIVGGLLCFVLAAVLLHSFKGRFGTESASKTETIVMEDTIDVSAKSGGGTAKQVLPVSGGSAVSSSQWVVYITGAVKKPGVYSVPSGARVYQALESAGGFAGDADQEGVNLAALTEDGEHIHFPRKGEAAAQAQQANTPQTTVQGNSKKNAGGVININTATAAELEALNGVGPKTAQAILAYREGNGPFARPEDIMLVKGIGAKKFEAMKGQISVGK